jgi:hypothetical protein
MPIDNNLKVNYKRVMEIIYHLPNEYKINRSPFDIAVNNVIKNKVIKIACPYIGLYYFEDVVIKKCKDWKLLTDINALIKSQQNKTTTEKMIYFLEKFNKKIRHINGLHAKVILSENKALVGSANFTNNGITENNEMSVIINDFKKIHEIRMWYDIWWEKASELNNEIFDKLRMQIKTIKYTKNNEQYISSKKLIKSSYEKISMRNKINGQKDEEYLINFLKHWNNKIFTQSYFDIAQYIIEKYDIDENDEKLCITFREEGYKIPITIGQRYILEPYWLTESVGLIMPLNYDKENAKLDGYYKEEPYKIKQKDTA